MAFAFVKERDIRRKGGGLIKIGIYTTIMRQIYRENYRDKEQTVYRRRLAGSSYKRKKEEDKATCKTSPSEMYSGGDKLLQGPPEGRRERTVDG